LGLDRDAVPEPRSVSNAHRPSVCKFKRKPNQALRRGGLVEGDLAEQRDGELVATDAGRELGGAIFG
jgi:hypothetical protein